MVSRWNYEVVGGNIHPALGAKPGRAWQARMTIRYRDKAGTVQYGAGEGEGSSARVAGQKALATALKNVQKGKPDA